MDMALRQIHTRDSMIDSKSNGRARERENTYSPFRFDSLRFISYRVHRDETFSFFLFFHPPFGEREISGRELTRSTMEMLETQLLTG